MAVYSPRHELIHGCPREEGGERRRESATSPLEGWKKNSDNLPRWDRSPCNSSRRKRCCSSEARASGNGTRPDRFARCSRRSSRKIDRVKFKPVIPAPARRIDFVTSIGRYDYKLTCNLWYALPTPDTGQSSPGELCYSNRLVARP